MNKKTMNLITSLASFIFEDAEYKRLVSHLKLKLLNSARLMVEEKLEFLKATQILYKEDEVITSQIDKCRELEDIIINEYIGSLTTT